jgi:hypothetical protein
MKRCELLIPFLFLGMCLPFYSQTYKNADIIFIKNKETKGKSLLPNGKSKFNYVGIIFIENNVPMVYHSSQPLSKSTLDDFLKLSSDGDFSVKRLIESELLSADIIGAMHTFAKAKLGSTYDNQLNLNNENLYNPEFVWKIYKSALGLPLSAPKEVKEYKVDNPVITEFLTDAYGETILNEKIVAVGDIFQSQFLE